MLTVKNLSFRYRKYSAPVLDRLCMSLEDGKIGILLGKNGSGKTTLFKTLLGIRAPDSGSVFFDGQNLLAMPPKKRAGKIAYVPQHIQFGALSVYDSILAGRISYFGSKAGRKDFNAVDSILTDMQLSSLAYRNADELSGGERQKVAIARALAQEPRLLILDEPASNLDIANEQLIIDEAQKIARERDISILCSLHDLNQALYFGDRFFFLKDGSIKYAGPKDIVTASLLKDIFDIDVRIVEIENKKIICRRNIL